MDRTRGDRPLDAGVVVGGADRDHLVPVAVGGLEDGAGDVGPGLDGAGAGAVIGAVGGVRPQHVEVFVSSSGFQLRQRFFSHVARKGFRFGKGVPLSLFGFAS